MRGKLRVTHLYSVLQNRCCGDVLLQITLKRCMYCFDLITSVNLIQGLLSYISCLSCSLLRGNLSDKNGPFYSSATVG